ncbi:hypothetical protein D8M06_17835 [Oceanobacillus halophilus]|uniref:Uncharacterized protein n=1 Tax=Oceanobacillus halophilus TaxID=930130 RepID=A0A494ZTG1_9BACI|nr:hypothetical protein D8M06_17835 [Oceanobacillus halophilus]
MKSENKVSLGGLFPHAENYLEKQKEKKLTKINDLYSLFFVSLMAMEPVPPSHTTTHTHFK